MSGIRVYEAARRLNMDTSRFMKLLASKGIKVKSPIAVITQSDLDKVTSVSAPAPRTAGKSSDSKTTQDAVKLSLVSDGAAKKSKKSAADVIPIDRVAQDQGAGAKPEEKLEEPKRRDPDPRPEKKQAQYGVSGVLALLLATAAVLLILTINSTVNEKIGKIDNAVNVAESLNGKVASLNDSVRLNQNMIVENRGSIADVTGEVSEIMVSQTRSELRKNSAALAELSGGLDGGISAKIVRLSAQLRVLASSL